MPQYEVSITRTVREDAIITVEADNEIAAEETARHEVQIGAADFIRATGCTSVSVDWVQQVR